MPSHISDSLELAKNALDGIAAHIMHRPEEALQSARVATKTALGKAGFAISGATAMQTAATVGVAGTGTAISSLSGAAATSSSLAWLGFGSMGTGAVVLLGVGAAGGYGFNAAYTHFYTGKIRKSEDLSRSELELLMACQALSSVLDEHLNSEKSLTTPQLTVIALEGLAPIAERLRRLIGKEAEQSKKLAKKRKLILVTVYHRLMLTIEDLSRPFDQPSALRAVRNGNIPLGLDGAALRHAIAQLGTDQAANLRKVYVAALERGLDPHWAVAGEEIAAQFLDSRWHDLQSRAADAKRLTMKYGPALGGLIADKASKTWQKADLPYLTDIKTWRGYAIKASEVAQQRTESAKPVFQRSWKQMVKGSERLVDVTGTLRSRLKVDTRDANLERAGRYTLSATVVFAVTAEKLLSVDYDNLTLEEDLVLQAMRRAIPKLGEANAMQISRYLKHLSPEELWGVLATCKGTYHELLYVKAQQAMGHDVMMHHDINHPGSDIVFTSDDGMVTEIQLKAVATRQSIEEHLARYPGLEIRTTDEMAELMGLQSTGFSNADLSEDVRTRLEDLKGDSLIEDVVEALGLSALVHAAIASKRLLSGSLETKQMADALRDSGIAIGTSLLLESLLFG